MGLRVRGAGRVRRLVHRLLHPRVRTWALVVLTVACTAMAVIIGLPPQSDLPTGLGRIIAIPVLPGANETRPYTVQVGWQVLNFSRTSAVLFTDTYWTEAGSFESETGLPVYLVLDDEQLTDLLLKCARGSEGAPHLTEVPTLPAEQKQLLDRYTSDGRDALSGVARYLRLDDLETGPGEYPFAVCDVPPESIFTRDDVEMHLQAPSVTTLTPRPSDNRAKDIVAPYVTVTLPMGWAPQDARAVQGTRSDSSDAVTWLGAEPQDLFSNVRQGSLASVRVLQVGPVKLEATSLNAARRADRRLFWSGLLVGLAGSCLLMLFESLPWRREEREAS